MLACRFLITPEMGEPEQVLTVLCGSEADALDAARMFAESAANVELWIGERKISI